MSIEEVCTAVRILHHAQSSETQRKEADAFLRTWQAAPEAWSQADQMLRSPELSPEMHHIAAVALRSKIMFDFVELPPESHQSLFRSLFEHIQTFQFASPLSVVQFLVLALADFSVHTAREWKTPVATLFENFNRTSLDANVLVMCLTALPEENANRRVLVDPAVRDLHLQLLRTTAHEVLARLESIKAQAVAANYSSTFAKVLACFVEWLPLCSDVPAAISNGSFLNDCFRLVHVDTMKSIAQPEENSSTDVKSGASSNIALKMTSSAVECLCEVYRICRRDVAAYAPLFEMAVTELGGPVKEYALGMVATEDWQACMQVARLYSYICDGLAEPLVEQLHCKESLQQIMTTVFHLTEIPFAATYMEFGENGVSSQMFPFWFTLIDQAVVFRRTKQTTSPNFSVTMSCCMDVFTRLLSDLLKAAEMPDEFWNDNSSIFPDDLEEFKGYREQICGLMMELRLVFEPEGLIKRLFQDFQIGLESHSVTAAVQESRLFLIQYYLQHIKSVQWNDDYSSVLQYIIVALPPEIPSDIIASYTRISAIGILQEAARHGWLMARPSTIRPSLENLIGQAILFSSHTSSPGVKNGNILENQRKYILMLAADTATVTCRYCATKAELQELLDNLIIAVTGNFREMHEDAHINLIEAVSIVIANVPDDTKYLQAVESLCNPMIQSIIELSDKTHLDGNQPNEATTNCEHSRNGGLPYTYEPSKWINRLAVAIKYLKPPESLANRQEALGTFAISCLWPLMEKYMKHYRDCKVLIEKCDRVLKHAMRLCPHKFREALPAFSKLLVENGQYKLFSTYLYAAEWLATEYIGYPDLKDLLSGLFFELTKCGIDSVQGALTDGRIDDQSDLLEDMYCMLNRYMKKCPLLAFSTDNLEKAFDVSLQIIYVEQNDVALAVFGFMETYATVASGKGFQEKVPQSEIDEFKRLVDTHICPRFIKRLPLLFSEFVRLIMKVPRADTLELICNVIDAVVVDWPREVVAAPLKEALDILPSKIIPSEDMKQRILVDIMTSDRITLENTLDEIHYRCRQVLMRSGPLVEANRTPFSSRISHASVASNNCGQSQIPSTTNC